MSRRPRPLPQPLSADRPLDSLLEGLQPPTTPRGLASGAAPAQLHALHPRVLELRVQDGYHWAFLCWRDPGGPRALHTGLRKLVEATLLHELVQPPSRGPENLARPFTGMRFIAFAELPELHAATRAFGFTPQAADDDATADVDRVIAAEAEAVGIPALPAPSATLHAAIQRPTGAWGDKLDTIQRWMAERMGDDVWGRTPGGPSRLLATYLQKETGESFEPTLDGLDRMEFLLVSREPGAVRWIPPLIFQALCDFVGVVLKAALEVDTAWALCEPEEDGLIPPPLFRLRHHGQTTHLPIGPHLLRWCMMPIAPGEEVPPLSAWLCDEFGRPGPAGRA